LSDDIVPNDNKSQQQGEQKIKGKKKYTIKDITEVMTIKL